MTKKLVVGTMRNKGISFKNNPDGQEYDMVDVLVLVDFQPGGGKNNKVTGCGLTCVGIPLAAEAMPQFEQFVGKFPLWLELETDDRASFGKLETYVVGVKGVVAPLKAA